MVDATSSVGADISSTFKITILSLMVITGAINTLAYKFQNKQYVFEGPYYKYFFHPYMQGATMFFGELLSIFVFLILKKRNPEHYKMRMLQARSKGKQIKINKLLLAVPALCDLCSSTLHYIALNFVSGSIYLMLRGGTIVTTCFFAKFVLKSKIEKHQYLGSGLVLAGVVVIGVSNYKFSGGSSPNSDAFMTIVGYILIIISLFFNGFFFIFEQKLLSKYYLEPLQVVGFEGIYGLIMYGILLSIISFIPCGFGPSACVFSKQGFPYLQSPLSYFRQAFSNGLLLFFCIIGIFSIALFNIAGVTVTKYINALARSVAEAMRTIIVWIVGIIVTITAGAIYPNYQWQLLNELSIVFELIGFFMLLFGNLIYNRIIELPWGRAQANETSRSLLSEGNMRSQEEEIGGH